MNEELFENPVEVRAAAPTPHFDDRGVLQRAQPVVPLNEIRTKLKLRRLWFLSGAFAIAMILGAASALVAVQIKRLAAPGETSQIDEPDDATATAQPLAVQVDPAPESTIAEEAPPLQQSARPAPRRTEPLASRPRIVNSHRDSAEGEPSEDEQLEQIREAVLYEQWQERRARRAARRERRNGSDNRDLAHLDEIFEGSRRRPDRPY